MDFGFGVSHTVSINEGHALLHAILRLDLPGRGPHRVHDGKSLQNAVAPSLQQQSAVRDAKEELSYSVFDFDTEMEQAR